MMELAWIVRGQLDRHDALPPLLEDVASTLVGVELAWGLAAELFPQYEDFIQEAAHFEPEDYADQYASRISGFKRQSLIQTQARFWWLENRCRRMLFDIAIAVADAAGGHA